MQLNRTVIQNLKQGDTKEVIRFAWLPKCIGTKRVLWESYTSLYVWIVTEYKVTIGDQQLVFRPGQWVLLTTQQLKEDKNK